MAYFYDNNVRKIPGPSYLFDYIYTNGNKLPSDLTPDEIEQDEALNAVQIGRYILYSPVEGETEIRYRAFAGTAWQKVVKERDVAFALVADRYTNPVEGLTGEEMQKIWGHVWGEEEVI